jgi:hypothetical protein
MSFIGCGGSDDDTAKRTSTPSSTATATATPSPTTDTGVDRRTARTSVLRLEDFPSGWTEADSDGSNKSKCEQVEQAKKATTARAESSRFGEGENTQAQHLVYLFADEAAAEHAFTQVSAKDTRLCYARNVTDALKQAGGLRSRRRAALGCRSTRSAISVRRRE